LLAAERPADSRAAQRGRLPRADLAEKKEPRVLVEEAGAEPLAKRGDRLVELALELRSRGLAHRRRHVRRLPIERFLERARTASGLNRAKGELDREPEQHNGDERDADRDAREDALGENPREEPRDEHDAHRDGKEEPIRKEPLGIDHRAPSVAALRSVSMRSSRSIAAWRSLRSHVPAPQTSRARTATASASK